MARIDIINKLNKSLDCMIKERDVFPKIIDIHPVSGRCNLNCTWCIGKIGYEQLPSLEDKFNSKNIDFLVKNILDNDYEDYWPLEFHICGCDSEPMLKEKEVTLLIEELKKRGRTVELITNGLLINENNVKNLVKLDKISFSVDVVNDKDFSTYKINKLNMIENGFAKVVENIKLLSDERHRSNSSISIYATFVATPKTFDYDQWCESFKLLKSVGVNHIQVRSDINEIHGTIDDLKKSIDKIATSIEANVIDYETENHFDIKYHSPSINEKKFKNCVSPYFWPAIGMDLKLYRCAHSALSTYKPFLDLTKESFYDSYVNYEKKVELVRDIGCNQKCPPTLCRINSKYYLESEK